jgi:KDO2-lipid IV(A) lauroyltransferase
LLTVPLTLWVAWRWVLPWSATASLGRALAWLVGGVLKVRLEHVVDAMRRAHVPAPERTARGMYRSLGRGVFELLWVGVRPKMPLAELVDFDSSILDEAFARGRGVVVATAHTGNWDLVACAAAERWPLTVVSKRLSIGILDWYWQRLRRRRGVKIAEVGGAARAAFEALSRREAVAMLIDQAPERERGTAKMRFLGRRALVDLGPALIAMRARAPLVAVFALRLPDGRHTVEMPGVLYPPEHASQDWVIDSMRTLTEWLEDCVLREPAQWLWMHRRWKGAGDDDPSSLPPPRKDEFADWPIDDL